MQVADHTRCEAKIRQLRAELTRAKMERDIALREVDLLMEYHGASRTSVAREQEALPGR
jgi:hypothetical protein